jgi:muramoyltetrapeptide carboxypeptidase
MSSFVNSGEYAVRPPALQVGDTVGVVAPASDIKSDALELGAKALRDLGYRVIFGESILDRDLYFAGTVERRVRELEGMFADPTVKAVICARGGYGTNYLLPKLNLDLILRNPKIFIGYSDITSLMTYFTDHGLVTFHGPMVAKDFAHEGGVELTAWRAVMGGEGFVVRSSESSELQPLARGSGRGVLYGGCLSMLVAALGTPYEPHTEGKLLFIEDIGAKPYQIDRMLMQLKLGGKLEDVKGILFGEMLDCVQPGGQQYSLQDVVLRVVGDLGVPIAYGFRSGHVSSANCVLPFGAGAKLEVSGDEVLFEVEAGTVPAASFKSSGVQSAP